MDNNKPSSYDIRDRATNKIIANVATNQLATDYCFKLELKPSFNNNTCWRYVIEPVRHTQELEYKNSGLDGL